MTDIKLRADHLKKLAWSGVYEKVVEMKVESKPSHMQSVIQFCFDNYQTTGRLRIMIADLKAIHQKKEAFVICTSSRFLVALAVHVNSICSVRLTLS
jgi:hypothetical protein